MDAPCSPWATRDDPVAAQRCRMNPGTTLPIPDYVGGYPKAPQYGEMGNVLRSHRDDVLSYCQRNNIRGTGVLPGGLNDRLACYQVTGYTRTWEARDGRQYTSRTGASVEYPPAGIGQGRILINLEVRVGDVVFQLAETFDQDGNTVSSATYLLDSGYRIELVGDKYPPQRIAVEAAILAGHVTNFHDDFLMSH